MYTMHEALARERMRETRMRASRASLAHAAAGQRRWHRLSHWAHAAETRHARRYAELAER